MSSETIQIMSTSSYPSTFLTIFEPGIMRSMAVPKEYLKYNGEKEFPDEYLYITKNNIIFDPIAIEIYWQMVRNNLKKKIANSNATTFLEVSDEC
jgi:hypothetical protein